MFWGLHMAEYSNHLINQCRDLTKEWSAHDGPWKRTVKLYRIVLAWTQSRGMHAPSTNSSWTASAKP